MLNVIDLMMIIYIFGSIGYLKGVMYIFDFMSWVGIVGWGDLSLF